MAKARRGDAARTNKAAGKATNAESSKESASRQAIIKKLHKSFLPESKFVSKLGGLINTNLGSFNLRALRNRMYGQGDHSSSIIAHNIMKSGLCAVVGFPPAIRCLELIMECVN